MMQKTKSSAPDKHEIYGIVRISGKDILGNKHLLVGLAQIDGVSWAFSNAVCTSLNIDKRKKIQELSTEEIKRIEDFIINPSLPDFIFNRRKDFDGGVDKHVRGSDLQLRRDFDIKRLRKIKSYKGNRHALGLPVRGQRTKANFRRNRRKSGAVGVKKKK